MNKPRNLYRKEMINNHQPEEIKGMLSGLFTYTDIRKGNIKQKQGDIVIINLKNDPNAYEFGLKECLDPFLMIKDIKTDGIYTNIYFKPEYFALNIEEINA